MTFDNHPYGQVRKGRILETVREAATGFAQSGENSSGSAVSGARKSEFRNPKQIQMTKRQIFETGFRRGGLCTAHIHM